MQLPVMAAVHAFILLATLVATVEFVPDAVLVPDIICCPLIVIPLKLVDEEPLPVTVRVAFAGLPGMRGY